LQGNSAFQIAIRVKSPKEIAEMLLREVMAESRLAPRKKAAQERGEAER
jgi:hypothetical protein